MSSSSMIVRLVWVPRSPERKPQREAWRAGNPVIPLSKFSSAIALMRRRITHERNNTTLSPASLPANFDKRIMVLNCPGRDLEFD